MSATRLDGCAVDTAVVTAGRTAEHDPSAPLRSKLADEQACADRREEALDRLFAYYLQLGRDPQRRRGARWMSTAVIIHAAVTVVFFLVDRPVGPTGRILAACQPIKRGLTSPSESAPHSDRLGQRNLLAGHAH